MNKQPVLKATHSGELDLNGIKLQCYVLQDGRRVLSGRGMQSALDLGQSRGQKIPQLVSSKGIKNLVTKDLSLGIFSPIEFMTPHKFKAFGYEATILVDLCRILLEARKLKVLPSRYLSTVEKAELLTISFAKVGIIALVDEATGYQYDREKAELQAILKAFISEEILKWQETFQLSFYKEIFRLWNIPFTAENIKRKPMFIGKLTNELVYKNMPKGIFVLDKLKAKTPKTSGGNYKYRLHQSLTPEVGREALKKVIYSIETLANISETKAKFLKLVQNRYGQRELPFIDLEDKPETKKIDKHTNFDITLLGLLSVPPPQKDEK